MTSLAINNRECHNTVTGTAVFPCKDFLHIVWSRVFFYPENRFLFRIFLSEIPVIIIASSVCEILI